MKKITLLFLTLLFSISLSAQLGVHKKRFAEAHKIKELPLLVVLHEYDNPFYENMNALLKEAMPKYWTYSKSVEFVTRKKLREISKDKSKKDKYAYFMFSETMYQANVHGGLFCIGLLERKAFTHFKKFGNPEKELTLADFKQGLYWLQNDLTKVRPTLKEAKANTKKLFNKFKEEISNNTLLIDKDLITDKLKNDIPEIYKYNYKIVSKEKIDEAIINETPNIIYLKTLETFTRPIGNENKKIIGVINTNTTNNQYDNYKPFSVFTVNFYKSENNDLLLSVPAMSKGKVKLKHFKKLIESLDK